MIDKDHPLANLSREEENSLAIALRNYTTEGSDSYDPIFTEQIRLLQPKWLEKKWKPDSQDKKEQILALAKNGDSRPSTGPLRKALSHYINKNGGAYDPEFEAKIRKLRPDWFEKSSDAKKRKLRKLAKAGESKPNYKTTLGRAFASYIRPSSPRYDPEFVKVIKEIAPSWLERKSKKPNVEGNKEQIRKIAQQGLPRPPTQTRIGSALRNYTGRHSNTYDPEFRAELEKLRPDWFESLSDGRKEELLAIGESGEPRPHYRSALGNAFFSYTGLTSGSYDPEFTSKLKKLRPDWFETRSGRANAKKAEILKIASNGDDKPLRDTVLGRALNSYIRHTDNSYDPEFEAELRKLRPDWFVTQSEKAQEKKNQILDMAKNGESRPHSKKHPLGRVFRTYTNSNNKCYDPEFDAEVRKLRPDWFRKSKRKSND